MGNLSAGAAVTNTDVEWNETRSSLKQWGTSPTLIEPVTGQLLFRNLEGAHGVTMAALDGGGRRIGAPVAATKTPQIPTAVWWHNFERISEAYKDLNCAKLL